MDTAGAIRTILLVDIVAMTLLAVVYLRQRRMRWMAYCGWGLLALFVPVLGPFLVIANRPGQWDPNFSLASDARRVGRLVQLQARKIARLFSGASSPRQQVYFWMEPWRMNQTRTRGKKLSRLDRARQRRQDRLDSDQWK